MSHEGAPQVTNEGRDNFHVSRTTVCHMFCRMTKMAAWELCLQDGGISEGFTHKSWWRGSVVERRSLAGELSLSCARPAADG